MGVIVEVQGSLLRHTKGKSEFEVRGGTVGEVLETIRKDFPDLHSVISDPSQVQIFMNGEIQIKPGVDNLLSLPDGTSLMLVMNIAGGKCSLQSVGLAAS
jgi:hypothetical protein